MPIHVVVAEAGPLISEDLALDLSEDPGLIACPAPASPPETFEQCRRSAPAVLLAAESFLGSIEPHRLREEMDYGRGVRVIVLGSSLGPEQALGWLRLGCMGYLGREAGMATARRAIAAVAAGQIWARRVDLALLLRQALAHRPRLTAREQEILKWMNAGSSHAEIAARLFISVETVRWHTRRLLAKIGESRSQAGERAAYAVGAFHRLR